MAEIIAIIANIVTIISGIVAIISGIAAIFTGGRFVRIVFLVSVCAFALIGNSMLIYVFIYNKPVAMIVTSFSSFSEGNYKGKQQQFYSFPINFYNKFLDIKYRNSNDKGDGQVSSYLMYSVSSSDQYNKLLDPTTNIDINFQKNVESQVFVNTNFSNTIGINDGNSWDEPSGWAGINFETNKIYPAREVILVLDFRELGKSQEDVLKNTPRFLFVDSLNPKPTEITEQGEELLKNRFKEMQELSNSKGLIWSQRIENPPQGLVLLRWKPN